MSQWTKRPSFISPDWNTEILEVFKVAILFLPSTRSLLENQSCDLFSVMSLRELSQVHLYSEFLSLRQAGQKGIKAILGWLAVCVVYWSE